MIDMRTMDNFAAALLITSLFWATCCSCSGGDDPSVSPGDPTGYTTDVEYYEFAPSVKESELYTVKVAGKYVTVYPTHETHLAWFGVDEGKVQVEVTLQGTKISSATVRPVSIEHNAKVKDGKLVFEMSKYDKVSVEFNGSIDNPLFIFANPIDSLRPSKDDPSVKYYEAGKVYTEKNIVLTEACKEIYLEPGTIVEGNILGADLDGVKIHGGGLLLTSDYVGRYASEFYQPFSIAFTHCPNSRFEDFTNIFAAGGWSSLYTNCDNSEVYNVHTIGIETSPGEKTNNDSMDIIGGKNVKVTKTFLYGHDDCFCLKSQKFLLKGDVDGIYYEDCIGWNVDAGNTFEIGYETNIDIKNVHYKNIYAIHSGTSGSDYRRAGVSIHNGGRATISDVTYENVYLEDVMEFGIYLSCLSHDYNAGYDDDGNKLEYSPGYIKNVTFTNLNILSVHSGKGYCVIRGYDSEHIVSDVSFSNFKYCGKAVTSLNDPIWRVKTNCSNIIFNN